uniref:Uncharacterized protein n=1 Tax=Neogobius melanostomus TaxID=47308 RepID=A0A8C6SSE2_9GOBI
MSASITRAEGVTVLTVTSDGDPVNCPLLCQLMCMLCYCPGVNVFKRQLSPQRRSQSVLGALQIMIGVLNIGLGLIECSTYRYYYYPFAAWFGVLFIIVGITSILSERFSCSLMVVLSVILNLCGVAFALATLIHYSIQMSVLMRDSYYDLYPCKKSEDSDHYWYRTTTPSPDLDALQEKCLEGKALLFVSNCCL